jgi:hypothetical protein
MWGKITISRIGIIGSFRTSPVNTVLDWFAMVLPIEALFLLLFPKTEMLAPFYPNKTVSANLPSSREQDKCFRRIDRRYGAIGDGHFQ